MPTFSTKSTAVLVPEGFYVAQARGVTQVQKTTRKQEQCMVFVIPLFLPDGRKVIAYVYLLEQTAFAVRNLCKSGNITIPPIDGRAVITTDDLERRRFYIQVTHFELPDGRKVHNVKFNAPSWVLQQAPELAGVSFPNEAPPITLRVVPDDPGSAGQATAAPPSPSPSPETSSGGSASPEPDGLTDEELHEAIELARQLRAKKQASPE